MVDSCSGDKGLGSRALVSLAAFVIVIAGLRAAQPILTPFFLAAFLAIICFPPLSWMVRKGVPDWLALLVVIAIVVLLLFLVVLLIGTSFNDFSQQLPEYQERLMGMSDQWINWLEAEGIDTSDLKNQEPLGLNKLMGLVKTILGTVGSLFSNVAIVLLLFIFILIEANELPTKLDAVFGTDRAKDDRQKEIVDTIRSYVSIKTSMSLVTGGLVTILLFFLGVHYALLWGLLAFLFNFIPNIGSVIAAIPPVMLALVQLGPAEAVYTGIGFLVINTLIGNVIEPRVMGKGLGLSTLVVFLSLIFWGWVLGPVGMLLSVPLTIVIKIILGGSEKTRWIAIMLASSPPLLDVAKAEGDAPET